MIEHGFKGIDRDTSFKHRDPHTYWDALNIRIILNDGNLFLSPLLGNTRRITLGAVNNIIGFQVIDDFLYLFVTNNNGVDSIIEVDKDFNQKTIYTGDLNFSVDNPIESLANVENDNVWKLYWVDGVNQLRTINVKDPEAATIDSELLDVLPAKTTSQPVVTNRFSNGSLKAGSIQYAYTLYNISGAQTKLSPVSSLHVIGGPKGGGNGDAMPAALEVTINDIDTRYDALRLYSVHYSDLNTTPEIKLIYDESISSSTKVLVDYGTSSLDTLTPDMFLALGGDLMIPYTLNSKKQRLFLANYKVDNLSLNVDTRAYSWANDSSVSSYPSTLEGRVDTRTTWYDDIDLNKQHSSRIYLSVGLFETPLGFEGRVREGDKVSFNFSFQYEDSSNVLIQEPCLAFEIEHIQSGDVIIGNPSNGADMSFIDYGNILASSFKASYNESRAPYLLGTRFDDIVFDETFNEVNAIRMKAKLAFDVYYTLSPAPSESDYPGYKLTKGDVNIDKIPNSGYVGVHTNLSDVDGNTVIVTNVDDSVDVEFDSINSDYDKYKYQYDASTIGGEGKHIKYSLFEYTPFLSPIENEHNHPKYKGLKRGEIYRIGIEFYDKFGRASDAKWIADVKIPYVFPTGDYTIDSLVHLRVELKDSIVPILESNGIVGYRILRVERKQEDSSIVAQGFVVPSFSQTDGVDGNDIDNNVYPYAPIKDIKPVDYSLQGGNIGLNYTDNADFEDGRGSSADVYREIKKHDDVCFFYSPDITFGTPISTSKFRILGYAEDTNNNYTRLTRSRFEPGDETVYERDRTVNRLQFRKFVPNLSESYDDNIHILDDDETPLNYFGVSVLNDASSEFNSFSVSHYREYGNVIINNPYDIASGDIDMYDLSRIIDKSGEYDTRLSYTAKNNPTIDNFTTGKTDPVDTKFASKGFSATFAKSAILQFDNEDWHTTNSSLTKDYNKFRTNPSSTRAIPIGELIQDVPSRYGGSSYANKQRNLYLKVGGYEKLLPSGNISTVYNGDTFLANYRLNRVNSNDNRRAVSWNVYEYINVPLETRINVEFRHDSIKDIESFEFFSDKNILALSQDDQHKYNGAYNQEAILDIGVAKPIMFRDVEHYRAKVVSSAVKFNNEIIDSWTDFSEINSIELNSLYGPIVKLQELRGELVAFQNKAIAFLSILPRVQTQATDGKSLELGVGKVLHEYDYLTTTSGTFNKWGIAKDKQSIYYYDEINNSFNILQNIESEISTLTGLDSFFKDNLSKHLETYKQGNPHKGTGVFTYYDNINEDINISFLAEDDYQIVYNLLSKKFTSFRNPVSRLGFMFNEKIMTIGSELNKLYQEYTNTVLMLFDKARTSFITLLSSHEPSVNKIYNNIEFQSEEDTPDSIRVWNDYQDTGEQCLDVKRKYRMYRAHIPRELNSRSRMSDTKAYIKLSYTKDKLMKLYEIIVKYTKRI